MKYEENYKSFRTGVSPGGHAYTYAAEGGEGVLPHAYAHCLNCALLLFFCVQGGGGVKNPIIFAYVLCA